MLFQIRGFWAVLLAIHPIFSAIPFGHKLIFSDTPEMGTKWHGGIRMQDIVVWDFSLNLNDWVFADFLAAGLSDLKTDKGERITDNFTVLTLKSPPFSRDTRFGGYALAGGMKLYHADFSFSSPVDSAILGSKDGSAMLFLTQSLSRRNHYFNLFSSLSFREIPIGLGEKRTSTTFYLVPGYQYGWTNGWGFDWEYYLTNTERLPIKVLQYVLDKDKIDFYNPNRDLYSFMFWGFHYTRRHLRLDFHIGNHISFRPPFIPVLGLGWYF